MLKSYLWAFQNWKQNRKTPYGSIFIAIFGYADGRKITHTFGQNCKYLSLYLTLWVKI